MNRVADIAALEAVIGRAPPTIDLKVIDHLDPGALHWLSRSPLAFVGIDEGGISEGRGVALTIAGGAAGFADGDERCVAIPLSAIDDPLAARAGAAVGMLFLAPGIGETLRVNGRVASLDGGRLRVAVEECYVHCAKALIRSDFWKAEPDPRPRETPDALLDDCRFLALASVDAAGRADLSPKGDPAGTMVRMIDGALAFADRPGNRRADSHRNIIANPVATAMLLVPGSFDVLTVRGTARLSTDAQLRERFVVQGKLPALVTLIAADAIALRPSAALARARLWPVTDAAEGIIPAKLFAAHVKLNRDKGLAARIAGAMVSIPGMMQKALDKDYRDNLY